MMTVRAQPAVLRNCTDDLCGCHLGGLERAEDTARRKEIYEALHPETKRASSEQMQAVRRSDKMSPRHSAFAEDTAAKTGQSRRTVERAAAIGEKLVPELKDAIPEDPDIADNQSALSALASQPEEVQRKLVAEGAPAICQVTGPRFGYRLRVW